MDEYQEQYYWQIEKEYHEHFDKLERQFTGMDQYTNEYAWGNGRYTEPPF
jgi:hypothetical protein